MTPQEMAAAEDGGRLMMNGLIFCGGLLVFFLWINFKNRRGHW